MSATAQHKGLIIAGCLLAMFLVEALVALATASPRTRRRRHFWLRFALSVLAMPAFALALTEVSAVGALSEQATASLGLLLMMCCIPALVLVPGVLFEHTGPPGPEDDGGGGNGGPSRPPSPRDQPLGDLPLPDAEPAQWRLRDHVRPTHDRTPARRRIHEPDHVPALPARPGPRH